jgi:hypothetical protein
VRLYEQSVSLSQVTSSFWSPSLEGFQFRACVFFV